MLSCVFLVQGLNAVRNPEPLVPRAKPVADRIVPLVKKVAPPQIGDHVPEDTKNLVRLNGAAQLVGGLALATGNGRRLGAALLAASLVPTTLAGHRWWEIEDPTLRNQQRVQFMKNVGLFGGLLLAAVDTEGQPGLAWRATHGTQVAKRETARRARLAKREARRAARAAKREALVRVRLAKAELPFTD
jgi:putative oxidoreductase